MRGRIVFLLEEPSMKALLDGLLPRLFPAWQPGEQFLCVPHQGNSDLDRSVPVKLRAWQHPDDRFLIVRDNDNADCIDVKGRFRALGIGGKSHDAAALQNIKRCLNFICGNDFGFHMNMISSRRSRPVRS